MEIKVSNLERHLPNQGRHFNTPQILFGGFLAAILCGALLLCLPISSASNRWTSFVDALFTSTTSVCVTGLTVVPTYSHWSIFGKVVILALIQLGGLGVICFAIGIFVVMGKRITLKERILIQDTYNLDSPQGMVKFVLRIFKGTALLELFGAFLYAIQFVPEYGVVRGVCFAVFHSVSAFCNAGLDLIGEQSLIPYQSSVLINFTTMFLIVSGGIGFTVWWDVLRVLRSVKKSKRWRQCFSKLQLHSKLALVTTAALILGGTLLFFVFEYNNKQSIGTMHVGDKLMASLFESVTTRTAGFATMGQEKFEDATTLVVILLMLIGGSPMGTAGGIKTTTVAMIFISIKSTVKGSRDTETFGRKIGSDNVKTGLAVAGIFLAFFLGGVILLSISQNMALKDLGFEAASAIATVGLTRGITTSLDTFGKLIVTLLMFIGRIGPITMAMAFTIKSSQVATHLRELPEKKILVG